MENLYSLLALLVPPTCFSRPLKCETLSPFLSLSVTHSFLISRVCPIKLLGRDLMLLLGINLSCSPDGLHVEIPGCSCMLLSAESNALYVYEWLLPLPLSRRFVRLARSRRSQQTELMSACCLHCTAFVTPDSHHSFAKEFLTDLNDSLTFDTLFWIPTHSCISVSLTPHQLSLFRIPYSFPHVSLQNS